MEHLAFIECLVDAPIPSSMSSRIPDRILKKGLAFEADGSIAWPACAANQESVEKVAALQPLRKVVQSRHRDFLNLLLGLLEIRPEKRLTADMALKTSFLTSRSIRE